MAMQLVDKLIRRTVKTTNYILTESSKQRRVFEQKRYRRDRYYVSLLPEQLFERRKSAVSSV